MIGRYFDPEDIPVADGYSRDDFGTPDEVRGWNLCREFVISMWADCAPVIPSRDTSQPDASYAAVTETDASAPADGAS